MELPNIAAYAYQDVHVWSALLTCLRPPTPDAGDFQTTQFFIVTELTGQLGGRVIIPYSQSEFTHILT